MILVTVLIDIDESTVLFKIGTSFFITKTGYCEMGSVTRF